MKKLMILSALALGAGLATAELRYEFQDTSKRVEVVPSQGASEIAPGFSARLADREQSESVLLSLWRGLMVLFR